MPARPDALFALLDRLKIAHRTVSHPAMFTVEDGRDIVANIPGAHTKNLFLKDKSGRMALFVALQDTRIDLKALPAKVGLGRLSFGSPERLMRHLGVPPGSVTPFAALNDKEGAVEVLLEAGLMAHDILNFHPLINTMTTSIARADLLRFLEEVDHPPRIVELNAQTGQAIAIDGKSAI